MLLTTIKITPAARLCLRRVAALTEEKHYEVLDRLLKQEEMQLRSLLSRGLPVCIQTTTITREQYHQLSEMMTEQDISALYPNIEPAQ